MKKLTNTILTLAVNILLTVGGAQAQTPKDQIALQLGAIQMGYQVPFTISENSSAIQKQQAANALVMGRNAMNATISAPAVTVKGVLNSPNVNTVEYRDQLYEAVEYVITSPINATVEGVVAMSNNSTVVVNPTNLMNTASDWTTPVPYAVEARTSVDTQLLREELEAAGILKPSPTTTTSIKSYFFITAGNPKNATESLVVSKSVLIPRFNGVVENFGTWFQRKVTTNDRVITKNHDFWANQLLPSAIKESVAVTYNVYKNDIITNNLQLWVAIPITEPTPVGVLAGGYYTLQQPITKDFKGQPLNYNGTDYKLVKIFSAQSQGVSLTFQPGK